jgi:Transposase DDE domain
MARRGGAVHVVTTRRRGASGKEYVAHLLRHTYREDGKVKNETVGNISHLPDELIELVRGYLRGQRFVDAEGGLVIERSLPHGHVEAVLAMARRLELGRLLDRASSRERDVVVALICQRVLWPASKLASVRAMASSTLAGELGVEDADENEVYAALDWLVARQPAIERRLARRHLKDGGHVLYDVSSSWFEGHSCPLAQLGYSRDGRRGTPQLVYGLCCDRLGRPLAIEAYRGALHDSQTIPDQLAKLRQRFGLRQVVVVVDRGMVTAANLDACREAGFGFISALGAPQVKRLARQGDLQLSLLDETNLAEISSDAFPGERLVVCRNPLVGAQRASKRAQLLDATEHELAHVQQRVAAGTLQGSDQIGLAVGSLWNRYRVKKHFTITITDTTLTIERKHDQIATEAALDGLYLLRTNLPPAQLPSGEVVRAYKQLAHVERAHRCLKGPDLELRPIHHHREDRVRAHLLLCMLAYYLEFHLRYAWRELLFSDEHPPLAQDPVAPAKRSPDALTKTRTKQTTHGHPCHSWPTLLAELATRTRNTIRLSNLDAHLTKLSQPTALHARAIDLARSAPLPM